MTRFHFAGSHGEAAAKCDVVQSKPDDAWRTRTCGQGVEGDKDVEASLQRQRRRPVCRLCLLGGSVDDVRTCRHPCSLSTSAFHYAGDL